MRIVLELSYDGTHFFGWQTQPDKRTVQQTLEEAISSITGEPCMLIGSGRTDSGVHAERQVAHFDVKNSSVPPEKYAYALNPILPPDVKIIKSFLAPEGFHARYSAKRKTYVYRFYKSRFELPLLERYCHRAEEFCDEQKMRLAAKKIEGTHDFKCFLAANSLVKDTVRTVYSCEVIVNGSLIDIKVCGNGFLYNMVRTIAGTLYFVGLGKMTADDVAKAIDEKDRTAVGKTMAAKGLTLLSVEYE